MSTTHTAPTETASVYSSTPKELLAKACAALFPLEQGKDVLGFAVYAHSSPKTETVVTAASMTFFAPASKSLLDLERQ